MAFGNRHFASDGISSVLMDEATGKPADPVMVDRASGKTIDEKHFLFAPGPAANDAVLTRLAFAKARRRPAGA